MSNIDNEAEQIASQEAKQDSMPSPKGIQNRTNFVVPKIKRGLTRDSIKRLQQIRFDPIQRMVMLYNEVTTEIHVLTYDEEGKRRPKFSTVLLASLLATKQKLINDLMKYGYSPAAETVNINENRPKPKLIIQLTQEGDSLNNVTIGEDTESLGIFDEDVNETIENDDDLDYDPDADNDLIVPENKIVDTRNNPPPFRTPKKKLEVPEGVQLVSLSNYSKIALTSAFGKARRKRNQKILESELEELENY